MRQCLHELMPNQSTSPSLFRLTDGHLDGVLQGQIRPVGGQGTWTTWTPRATCQKLVRVPQRCSDRLASTDSPRQPCAQRLVLVRRGFLQVGRLPIGSLIPASAQRGKTLDQGQLGSSVSFTRPASLATRRT